MNSQKRRWPKGGVAAVAAAVLVCLGIALWIDAPVATRAAKSDFEMAVATLPIGSTEEQAIRHFGSEPDSTVQEEAILVSSSLMFAADSEQGLPYGQPQSFKILEWKRGELGVSVVLDTEGKVVAKLNPNQSN